MQLRDILSNQLTQDINCFLLILSDIFWVFFCVTCLSFPGLGSSGWSMSMGDSLDRPKAYFSWVGEYHKLIFSNFIWHLTSDSWLTNGKQETVSILVWWMWDIPFLRIQGKRETEVSLSCQIMFPLTVKDMYGSITLKPAEYLSLIVRWLNSIILVNRFYIISHLEVMAIHV